MACTMSIHVPHISIHALREEGDTLVEVTDAATTDFYPRPPRGGRHINRLAQGSNNQFLSTPSARRATNCQTHNKAVFRISVHALREEGDRITRQHFVKVHRFLSTPSARRATVYHPSSQSNRHNFYPRPPRGGRPCSKSSKNPKNDFYPRPPRGGRPLLGREIKRLLPDFYPRPPRGGRRFFASVNLQVQIISIHALREEGDAFSTDLS